MAISNFHSKKRQRDQIFEISKKEHESKFESFKNDNIYCLKNAHIVSLVSKSSIQGFSKFIQREHQTASERALLTNPPSKHTENIAAHMFATNHLWEKYICQI
jgi:hypothetical protein